MDDELQNTNPTILNASDLPTRRRPSVTLKRADGGTGLFDALLPAQVFPHDPFSSSASSSSSDVDAEDDAVEPIDEQEIYDLIAPISDPEHPLSLGSLAVVNLPDIYIKPPTNPRSDISTVLVEITPTITHCSLATVIGLGVRVRRRRNSLWHDTTVAHRGSADYGEREGVLKGDNGDRDKQHAPTRSSTPTCTVCTLSRPTARAITRCDRPASPIMTTGTSP